jgi:phosphoribosyl-dephospho-CoA transferase
MVELNTASRVFDAVTTSLQDATARELWIALRSELVRADGGPDAMKEYLESEASRIKQLVEQAILRVSGAS